VLYANEARKGVPTRIAMRLMLLVFVRTSELIETPWSEIDLEKGEWILPWKCMKRGKRRINPDKNDHHVYLSRQALGPLRELHRHTGGGTWLFPNLRDPQQPMSNNTPLKAIESMGFKGDRTRFPGAGHEYPEGGFGVPSRGRRPPVGACVEARAGECL
jgi:integrase